MWEMAQRYGHFDIDTLREHVEGISRDAIFEESRQKSRQSQFSQSSSVY
jgi:hypothetical protein